MEEMTDEELLEIEALVEAAVEAVPPFRASVIELVERRLMEQRKSPQTRLSTVSALLRLRARLRSARGESAE